MVDRVRVRISVKVRSQDRDSDRVWVMDRVRIRFMDKVRVMDRVMEQGAGTWHCSLETQLGLPELGTIFPFPEDRCVPRSGSK
jgi:hypothetical protein